MLPKRCHVVLCGLVAVCGGCGAPGEQAYADPDAQLRAAHDRFGRGQHASAAAAFAAFARRFPHDPRAHLAQFWTGEARAAAHDYPAALAAYDRLYRTFPYSHKLAEANRRCLEIGRLLITARDPRGVAALERVVDRAPYSRLAAEAHELLGLHYYEAGRFADAKHEFDAILAARPGAAASARAEFRAAFCEYRQIDRPVRNLDRLESARARFTRLRTSALRADDARLVDKYLRRVLDLGAEHHLRMAAFHLKQGRLDPARVHLAEVLRRYPGSRRYAGAATAVLELIHAEVGRAAE